MASYRGHLTFAGLLGAGYGSLALLEGNWDWGTVLIAAGLTTLGGLLPDLDSDSGVPVRELFGVAAAIAPILLFDRVKSLCQQSTEQTVVVLAATYLFIRYVLSYVFKTFTVHRGMFHSIPALLIAGLAAYLIYPSGDVRRRIFLSGAVMIGFLSHLILDEIYSVDFMGARLRLNKYAGSALKLVSKSWPATVTTYLLLGLLAWRVLVVAR
jgi:LexA-binding, inner membrane-associated putative hydrolase